LWIPNTKNPSYEYHQEATTIMATACSQGSDLHKQFDTKANKRT
jgi:hypothetical protein